MPFFFYFLQNSQIEMSHYYLGTFNNLLNLLPPIKAKGPKTKHNSSAK